MKIEEEKVKLPNWENYFLGELDYFAPNERHSLMCRYKLTQIYQNIYIARIHLLSINENNEFIDIKNTEISQSIKKIFIQNALIYYNFCIDLSWSMIYLYCMPKISDNNITENEVKKAEGIVNYEFLKEYLSAQYNVVTVELKNKIGELIKIIDEFWKYTTSEDCRKIYNYTKHQGAYDIFNLNPQSYMKIEGIKNEIEVIKSEEFNEDKMITLLTEFHNQYIEYIEKIINIIIDSSNIKHFYNFDDICKNIYNNKK